MAGHWKQSQARGRSQSSGETGRTDRARNEPRRSCAECWQQWAHPGWLPRGTQSSQASCCLSQSSVHLKCWSLTYKLLQIVFSKEKPESVGSIKNEGSKWKEYWTWPHETQKSSTLVEFCNNRFLTESAI